MLTLAQTFKCNSTSFLWDCHDVYLKIIHIITILQTANLMEIRIQFLFAEMSCGQPQAVTRSTSQRTQGDNAFGDVVAYTCDVDARHSGGDLTRACQSNGVWSGTTPTCTGERNTDMLIDFLLH